MVTKLKKKFPAKTNAPQLRKNKKSQGQPGKPVKGR